MLNTTICIFYSCTSDEPYFDIDYEELKVSNFLNSDDDSDKEEFSMLNPRLIDFE